MLLLTMEDFMNYKKVFLLFLSISLFSQPILLHAEESITKKTIKAAASTVYDSGKCALYYSRCATRWGLKKVFDHDLYNVFITQPNLVFPVKKQIFSDGKVIKYIPKPEVLTSTTVNFYQYGASAASSNVCRGVCLGACLIGGPIIYGYRHSHQKEKRNQILRQVDNWSRGSDTAYIDSLNLANKCYNTYIPYLKSNHIRPALEDYYAGRICYDDLKRTVDPTLFGQ